MTDSKDEQNKMLLDVRWTVSVSLDFNYPTGWALEFLYLVFFEGGLEEIHFARNVITQLIQLFFELRKRDINFVSLFQPLVDQVFFFSLYLVQSPNKSAKKEMFLCFSSDK